jgi:hypothetical protein
VVEVGFDAILHVVFLIRGNATVLLIVEISRMKNFVVIALTINSIVEITHVLTKREFVMELTTVAMEGMKDNAVKRFKYI